MAGAAASLRRGALDLDLLRKKGYDILGPDGEADWEDAREFSTWFTGPAGTPYEGGHFRVCVTLLNNGVPAQSYPFKSPSVRFATPIYHPNVQIPGGSVCVDVLNDAASGVFADIRSGRAWKPSMRLHDIFEQVLPELLKNPEPSSPLNAVAARKLNQARHALGKLSTHEARVRNRKHDLQLALDDHELGDVDVDAVNGAKAELDAAEKALSACKTQAESYDNTIRGMVRKYASHKAMFTTFDPADDCIDASFSIPPDVLEPTTASTSTSALSSTSTGTSTSTSTLNAASAASASLEHPPPPPPPPQPPPPHTLRPPRFPNASPPFAVAAAAEASRRSAADVADTLSGHRRRDEDEGAAEGMSLSDPRPSRHASSSMFSSRSGGSSVRRRDPTSFE